MDNISVPKDKDEQENEHENGDLKKAADIEKTGDDKQKNGVEIPLKQVPMDGICGGY